MAINKPSERQSSLTDIKGLKMSYNRFSGRSALNGRYGHAPMTDEQIRLVAPSVFAATAHESRSERYSYIPTSEVLAGMRREGFECVAAKQGNTRVEGKADYTKHMMRFRPVGSDLVEAKIGGLYPEVVIVNSHDGTSSYNVMPGVMRLVCLNGLLVADKAHESLRVHHKGDVVSKVIEGSFEVIEESRKAIETAGIWSGIRLDRDEQQIMAEAAHVIRFGDKDGETETAIQPSQLLRVRRADDNDNSLFTVQNVIQENVIRGNLTAWGRDANNRQRRVTTHEIKGIDQDVKLNRALWLLAERMAELKGVAMAA
jgi:hypothetical protein